MIAKDSTSKDVSIIKAATNNNEIPQIHYLNQQYIFTSMHIEIIAKQVIGHFVIYYRVAHYSSTSNNYYNELVVKE